VGGRQAARQVLVEAGQDCLVGRFDAMASPCEILIESGDRETAERLTRIAAAEAWRIEDKFSRYRAGNVVDRINASDGEAIEVDDETAALLDFADTLYSLSNGRFDITSGALRGVWTFDGGDRLPDPQAVQAILRRVGWDKVSWQRPVFALQPGMQIDLGGIGKEYAVDRVTVTLREAAACSALVNFGGDLAVTRAPRERRAWRVGIEPVSAADKRRNEAVLEIATGALATSGDSRRFLLKDGVRYSHILDPRSGWPVEGAPRSVTVAADTCTQAGMLSTLAMLEGYNAEAFLDGEGVKNWCRR
jgi:thiamine biosynthesis lipoprotein